MNWQPIETAPKGKQLILFFPEISHRLRGITHGKMIQIDLYPVAYPRKPTHWMPLPPEPTE